MTVTYHEFTRFSIAKLFAPQFCFLSCPSFTFVRFYEQGASEEVSAELSHARGAVALHFIPQ